MRWTLLALLGLSLSGCAMVDAVTGLPAGIGETNQRLETVGAQVTRSSELLEVSNTAMAGLPALMHTTHEGVTKTNALMTGTHELMHGTNALMVASNAAVAKTNEMMAGTHELMRGTNALIAKSNDQLAATFWLLIGTGLGSAIGGVVAFVRFRNVPRQLEELARAQRAATPISRSHPRSSRLASISGRN